VHKNDRIRFGLQEVVSSKGYRLLRIVHAEDGTNYITTFKNLSNARKILYFFAHKYTLCLKYVGLESPKEACSDVEINKCLGACAEKEAVELYNERVQNCIDQLRFSSPNLLIVDKGRSHDERSIILIQNNEYKGFGYADLNYQINNLNMVKTIITPMKNSRAARHILQSFIRKNKIKQVIDLNEKA
jgi:DNA polymerase-3 subunit epsilon